MERLAELIKAHNGLGIDKWEHYLEIYQAELGHMLDLGHPRSLLELGIQNGGSLQMWSKVLPPGSTIVGIDIDPNITNLASDPGIEMHVADVNDRVRLQEALGDRKFHIIIDDASHKSGDVIRAFKTLFERVEGGGVYIIEDLHASYWPILDGEFRQPHTSIEFLKGLVDGLHVDHFQTHDYLDEDAATELVELGAWIGRITFYDSLAVIQKLSARKAEPYRRVLNGSRWNVVNPFIEFYSLPVEAVGSIYLGQSVAELFREEARARDTRHRELESSLRTVEQSVDVKQHEINALASEVLVLQDRERGLVDNIEGQQAENLLLLEECQSFRYELEVITAQNEHLMAESLKLRRDENELRQELEMINMKMEALQLEHSSIFNCVSISFRRRLAVLTQIFRRLWR